MKHYDLYLDIGAEGEEPIYVRYFQFNTLEEASVYYDKFDGIEYFDENIFYKINYDFKFTVEIWYIDDDDEDVFDLIKGKYLLLNLGNYHPSFWKLNDELEELKRN